MWKKKALSHEELQEQLEKIKYKDGVEFIFYRSIGKNYLHIKMKTVPLPPNKQGIDEETCYLSGHFELPVCYTRAEFDIFVLKCIVATEMHEVFEWFLIDDIRMYDPHNKETEKARKMFTTCIL